MVEHLANVQKSIKDFLQFEITYIARLDNYKENVLSYNKFNTNQLGKINLLGGNKTHMHRSKRGQCDKHG